MVEKVLKKSVAAVRARAIMYKVVVHRVLFYGSKKWVVTVEMLTFLDVFYHLVLIKISGTIGWSAGDGGW